MVRPLVKVLPKELKKLSVTPKWPMNWKFKSSDLEELIRFSLSYLPKKLYAFAPLSPSGSK